MVDNCKKCKVPDNERYYDPDSEYYFTSVDAGYYFTCADCYCRGCEHLHSCVGQCAELTTKED